MRRYFPKPIDWTIIAIVLAMFVAGAILCRFPTWWTYCLTLLDVRDWPAWKIIAVPIAFLYGIVFVWFRPSPKKMIEEER
jgi:hypothetical protein